MSTPQRSPVVDDASLLGSPALESTAPSRKSHNFRRSSTLGNATSPATTEKPLLTDSKKQLPSPLTADGRIHLDDATRKPSRLLLAIAALFLLVVGFTGLFLFSKKPAKQHQVDSADIRVVSVRTTDEDHLTVTFENLETHALHNFALKRDRSMFSSSFAKHVSTNTYMTRLSTEEWASAQYIDKHLFQGHFSSPKLGGHFTVHSSMDQPHAAVVVRRALEQVPQFEDEVFQAENRPVPPFRRPALRTAERDGGEAADRVQKFTPGCFDNDAFPHQVKIAFAVDQGFMDKIGAKTLAEVQTYVESMFGVVRVLYLIQLNIYVQIDRIVLPEEFPDTMLSRSPNNRQCASAAALTLSSFNSFLVSSNLGKSVAHWHLLTNCHPSPGTIGAAFVGGLCLSSNNCGISSWNSALWLTVAHEMGHVFGAEHTFESGNQGGIMDYGNGKYRNGLVEFNPLNRDDICPVLQYTQKKCPAQLFSLVPQEDECGNGLLDAEEECECVDQTKLKCGNCNKCKLAQKVECSTQDYVVHTTGPGEVEIVSTDLLAHASCCSSRGKLVKVPTTCGEGVCSVTGKCEQVCGRYFIPPCGSGFENECVQRCLYDKLCQGNELTVRTTGLPVGAVPDGLECSNGKGTCQGGTCRLTVDTQQPTSSFPSAEPTTSFPSAEPTLLPTARPTEPPTETATEAPTALSALPQCPTEKRFKGCANKFKGVCNSLGCVWCGDVCLPSNVACESKSIPLAVFYSHCAYFTK